MSAIEQPAAKSGRIVNWSGLDKILATSAIKCTPKNTIYLASSDSTTRESLRESPV